MSFISDLCQIECVNMKGNIFIQTLHDKDLMWGTAMAFGMKIRSFVLNYFIMILKVASLNNFFSKPLIHYFLLLLSNQSYSGEYFEKTAPIDVVSAKFELSFTVFHVCILWVTSEMRENDQCEALMVCV